MKKKKQIIYTPDLEETQFTIVNPAVDFKDKAYFGVWLPAKEEDREIFCLVTSDRKIIVCQDQGLKREKIKLNHIPITFNKRRWNIQSIKDFLGSFNSVNPKDLYEEIKETYEQYVDFPHTDFMALWVICTYLFPLFKAFPYVYIGGIKQSGKTKMLHVTSLMAFNSIFSANATTSSIFRLIQNGRCSLFIDETEKLANPERALDFRSILLQGYKAGSEVQRVEKNMKEKHIVEFFEIYSPKMLANIFGLEDILEDRCIHFVMKRTINRQIGEAEVDESNSVWQEIRDRLYVFALENWEEIKQIYETLPNETNLTNREWELWRPILAIASFIDRNLYDKMKSLAEVKANEKHIENITETGEYILVESLLSLVDEDRFYKVKEIREEMENKFEEEQKWLTNKWVGRALGRLGFSEKRRVGGYAEYRLNPIIVKDLAERLGIISTPQTPLTTQTPPETNKTSSVSGVSGVCEGLNNKEYVSAICEYCGSYTEVVKINGRYICSKCVNTI